MHKYEAWVAKTLFWPPTIKVCQILKCTQYQFARWIRAVSYSTLVLSTFNYTSLDYMFLVAASILIGDAVISSPTRGESGWAWVRVAFLIALIISLATGAFLAALMTIGMFFAEYAFMIKNVPPADSKKFVDTLAYS